MGSQEKDSKKKHLSGFPETHGEMKKTLAASNKRTYASPEKPTSAGFSKKLAHSPGIRAVRKKCTVLRFAKSVQYCGVKSGWRGGRGGTVSGE
jgi:hypothetical protein